MKIIVDAFGGDNAPLEILKGAAAARKEYGCEIILCGDEAKIKACAREKSIDIEGMEIAHSEDVVLVEEDPRTILKEHKDSSMGLGLQLLAKGEGDAFVTAGSTGAVVLGGTFLVKRIKGVKRAAFASLLPSDEGRFMLMDCGANLNCSSATLDMFAKMATIYMEKVEGVENPRVALANIGVEENKGTEILVETHQLMKNAPYNFVGNLEARDIPVGGADIVICEGFTGNIILKMYEGVARVIFKNIKRIFKKSILSKLAIPFLLRGLVEFRKKMDYKEFGGAPLMGISKPIIKAHGSSDKRAFKNAIRQAIHYAESGAIEEITKLAKKEEIEEDDE
ncbi:MAG: phosphate acyltransferase PlsX [Ruminococcaceae bacterium]|nr:phosphate acyltransferase PlsX [Oscillospiraceae bacterium]